MNGISLLKFSIQLCFQRHSKYVLENVCKQSKGKFNEPAGASTIQGCPCSIWLLAKVLTALKYTVSWVGRLCLIGDGLEDLLAFIKL